MNKQQAIEKANNLRRNSVFRDVVAICIDNKRNIWGILQQRDKRKKA